MIGGGWRASKSDTPIHNPRTGRRHGSLASISHSGPGSCRVLRLWRRVQWQLWWEGGRRFLHLHWHEVSIMIYFTSEALIYSIVISIASLISSLISKKFGIAVCSIICLICILLSMLFFIGGSAKFIFTTIVIWPAIAWISYLFGQILRNNTWFIMHAYLEICVSV